MNKVHIIGGGISGLLSAYFLLKKGFKVSLYESSSELGGLIQTQKSLYGPIELGPNAFKGESFVIDLFNELNIDFDIPNSKFKARYIYNKSPKRWPLGLKDSLSLLKFLIKFKLNKKTVKPLKNENMQQWVSRVLNESIGKSMIEPALLGVYGVPLERLSADLVLRKYFSNKNSNLNSSNLKSAKTKTNNKKYRLICPKGGMGQLILRLKDLLISNKNFELKLNEKVKSLDDLSIGKDCIIIATPLNLTLDILNASDCVANEFNSFNKSNTNTNTNRNTNTNTELGCSGLTSATLFFKSDSNDLKGFGCLFPLSYGFNSFGVLFNSDIFSKRFKDDVRSETYILPYMKNLSDDKLLDHITEDRGKLGWKKNILSMNRKDWPSALPVFNDSLLQFQNQLKQLATKNIYFIGNYTEGIGLSSILEQAKSIPVKLKT